MALIDAVKMIFPFPDSLKISAAACAVNYMISVRIGVWQ